MGDRNPLAELVVCVVTGIAWIAALLFGLWLFSPNRPASGDDYTIIVEKQ